MLTTVHIPDTPLKQADSRAKALGISRNQLIVRALERELQPDAEWSGEFFEQLRAIDDGTIKAVDEMMATFRRARGE